MNIKFLSFLLFILVFSTFSFVDTVHGFQDDFHYNWTFYLGLKSGFSWEEARMLASANQRMDETHLVAGHHYGEYVKNYAENYLSEKTGVGSPEECENCTNWHAFGSDIRNEISERVLLREMQLWERIERAPDKATKLLMFGQFLHFVQDEYPHSGYPVTIGHFEDGHQPDSPGFDEESTILSTEKTLKFMKKFLNEQFQRTPNDVTLNDSCNVGDTLSIIINQSTPAPPTKLVDRNTPNSGTEENKQIILQTIVKEMKFMIPKKIYEVTFVPTFPIYFEENGDPVPVPNLQSSIDRYDPNMVYSCGPKEEKTDNVISDFIEVPLRVVTTMAANSTGHKFFSGFTNDSIVTATPSGNILLDYPQFIDEDRSSTGPYGMAFDSNDNLYFANPGGTIYKYDPQGNLIWQKLFLEKDDVGVSYETGWGMRIRDATVDSSDNLIVTGHTKIVKIDPDGTMILKFGSDCLAGLNEECQIHVEGKPQPEVYYPGGYFAGLTEVEVDTQGNIYTLESESNHRIQKFDSQGNFLKFFPRPPVTSYMPYHITMDNQNFLYASDRNEDVIYQFSSDGEFLQKWDVPYDIWALLSDQLGNVYYVYSHNRESSHVVKLIDSGIVDSSSNLKSSPLDDLLQSTEIQTPQIPSWVKTNAGWWGDNQIDDDTFVSGIQFMIKENLIDIPDLPNLSTPSQEGIPDWVRNNAKWWADGIIENNDFLGGIEYLVSNGIIVIGDETTIKVEETNEKYSDLDEDYVYPIGENEEDEIDTYATTNPDLIDNNKKPEKQPTSDLSTPSGTITIAKQIIKLPSDSQELELQIFGTFDGAPDHSEIVLIISDQQEQETFPLIIPIYDGYFELYLIIDQYWEPGNYSVVANFQDTEFARTTFQITN